MATLGQWDSGGLPTTSGGSLSVGAGPGFPASWIEVEHDGAGSAMVRFNYSSVTQTAVRFYWRAPANWPDSSHAISTMRTDSGIASRASVAGASIPGVMRLFATAGNQLSQSAGSSGPLTNSAWFRIEHQANHQMGQARLGIWALGSDTPLWQSGWQSGNLLDDSVWTELGATAGASPVMGAMGLAHILVSDDVSQWIGRHASDTIAGGGSGGADMGWWNGSQYVPLESIGVWDGTTFTPLEIEEQP